MNSFSRTELLIGKEGIEKLKKSKVAIFGIGGVGSYAAEALGRCGIGTLVLIDFDDICSSNINRQIHATAKTVGRPKVEAMKERLLDINPEAEIISLRELYKEENSEVLLSKDYDYVIDAIDMVTSKINLIVKCSEMGIPIISCMGAGNKLDPTKLEISDIYKTSVCPLARVMRYELRKLGIKKLKVVYSKEEPITPIKIDDSETVNIEGSDGSSPNFTKRRQVPGSISFVPSAAGLIIASAVVRDILDLK